MSTKKLQIIGGSILQSDWNVTDNTSAAYIKNKPGIPSTFTGSYTDLTDTPDLSEYQLVSDVSTVKSQYITLTAANWIGSESPYTQTIELPVATTYSKIDLSADSATLATIIDGGYCLSVNNNVGVFTVYATGVKPSVDLTLQVTITEVVKQNDEDIIVGAPLVGTGVSNEEDTPAVTFVVSTSAPINTSLLWIHPTNGMKYYDGSAWVTVPSTYS